MYKINLKICIKNISIKWLSKYSYLTVAKRLFAEQFQDISSRNNLK